MINEQANAQAKQFAKDLAAKNQRDCLEEFVASTPAWIKKVREGLVVRIKAFQETGRTMTAQNLQLVLDEIDPVIWLLEAE